MGGIFCTALLGPCFRNVSIEVSLLAEKSEFTLLKGPGVLDPCKQEISLKPHISSQKCVPILYHDHAFAFI